MRGRLMLVAGCLFVAAPASAQLETIELPDTPEAARYQMGVGFAADARAMVPPRSRRGDLRKQRWWIERQLRPWLACRRIMNRIARASVFDLYRGQGVLGALVQALAATISMDFARALLRVRAQARQAPVRRLYSAVIDPMLRDAAEGALLVFARCAHTAERIRHDAIRDHCIDRAQQLEADTEVALGADWRPGGGADPHRHY